MIQMGKSMPCLYEQMAAVPAMASAQQSGNSNNSSNNSSNNNSNNNVSQSYEEMLGGSSGAGGMSLVPQGGASGQFQPTPDEIEESRTVDKMAYNSWKGMLARNIGRAVIVSFLVGSQNTVVAVGTLQEVGNDYITLFHPRPQRLHHRRHLLHPLRGVPAGEQRDHTQLKRDAFASLHFCFCVRRRKEF